ncbi:MAG: family 20 glycosylhydrolase, partial [Candidatus Aminicenantes bacterium]|nr:family 20 glycosylhydrolase [Candidatus Aminicenantes bacterium]
MARNSPSRPLGRIALAVSALGFILAAFELPSAAAPPDGVLGLMPVPESVTVREGRFRVDDGLAIGGPGPATSRAFRAAARFMSRLAGRTGLFLKQDFLAAQDPAGESGIRYAYDRAGALLPNEDESYTLTVETGRISLASKTDIGILRGLETLLQLLSADEAGYYFPCVAIVDKPRFTWRGLLIDAGRHFHPVDVIKRNLDAMAAVKMNVLHWHLTEDQGFRVESKVFPKLHELGSDGLFYTQDQVKDIIAYAADRGIRVMPEFDVPGHATSWFVAYPELSSAPGSYAIERKFGVFGPAFNPANEKVYAFLDAFFKEMAGLFPDPYVHIGGDEVEGHQWDASPEILAFKKKQGLADNAALQAYFNTRLLNILAKHHKKMVGWEEVFQPGLPKDVVIHSWLGPKSLVEAARNGYRSILSNGYYIDLGQPATFFAGGNVRVGDRVAIRGPYTELLGGRVATKSLDNRASVAAMLGALGYLAGMHHTWDVFAVATVQEEIGLRGAITSAFGVAPDLAIAIDVTFGDTPGVNGGKTVAMDKGPAIGWGPNLHPGVVKRLREVADALEIPYVTEALPGQSGTDAWAVQVTREGIPTALLSIPIRYMHTAVETVVLADIDRTARLLAAFISRLDDAFLAGLAE